MGWVFGGFAAASVIMTGSADGGWSEERFFNKTSVGKPHLAVVSQSLDRAHNVIGSTRYYKVQANDTFLDIARYYGLGYEELVEANPGVDPWIPPEGQIILLPTEFVLPDSEPNGVVINIPEMRLYYFRKGVPEMLVSTYPVGLGRDDWRTPRGKFKIRGKTVNPTWVLPESIKAEHRRDGRPAPDFIKGGDPENPLGKHRFELTLPSYAIHGTNIPWGVGMQVSHGCVRLYPEDIERLFPEVPVGTPGEFVYQPVKVGARDGRIYVEVHRDVYGYLPAPFREARRLMEKFGWSEYVDLALVERAVVDQSGVPTDVTLEVEAGDLRGQTYRDASVTFTHEERHTIR
jgi:L,D-transpeptidase ErfK/SrfK